VAGNTKLHDVTALPVDALINCSDIILLIYVFRPVCCLTLMITGNHNPSTETVRTGMVG
jgi:hypothetical protein